jgi:hypothetical protein
METTLGGMVAVTVAEMEVGMPGMVAEMVVVISVGRSVGMPDREEAHPRIILIWAVIDFVVKAEMDNTEI